MLQYSIQCISENILFVLLTMNSREAVLNHRKLSCYLKSCCDGGSTLSMCNMKYKYSGDECVILSWSVM